jgi:thiamine-monophosphate kinase
VLGNHRLLDVKKRKMKKNTRTETEFIESIRTMARPGHPDVIMGIGDDCAVIRGPRDQVLLITTDMLLEGVHFDLSWHPPRQLGRKAAAVNLSDVAAMGGRAVAALLSICIPDPELPWIREFLAGFVEVLQQHGADLVGGDTVRGKAGTLLSITILGEMLEKNILYRSGALHDDLVWISGPVGLAAAGLELLKAGPQAKKKFPETWQEFIEAHLDPEPQMELGRLLAESGLVHAMMDISDGLATDLAHMCAASGVGAEIAAHDLPLSKALAEAAKHAGVSAIDWQLKGGEDYQLLFAAPAKNETALRQLAAEHAGGTFFCIGRFQRGSGVFLRTPDETRTDITYQGYDHFR